MVLVLPETTNPSGDESDLLDFSFASLPTRSAEESATRKTARKAQSDRAAHAYHCAEVDGRDPIASARTAAAQIGGAL